MLGENDGANEGAMVGELDGAVEGGKVGALVGAALGAVVGGAMHRNIDHDERQLLFIHCPVLVITIQPQSYPDVPPFG